ncbi:MAG TPA: ABC transporter substrate-binding protein, partial [Nitriliruptorales bacterium]
MSWPHLARVGAGLCALAVACAPTPLEPLVPVGGTGPGPSPDQSPVTPAGHLSVAIPEAPGHLADPFGDDVAAQDVAGLWGLPLYRVDPAGQLRPGLVEAALPVVTNSGLEVTLTLRRGSWSDGSPVTAVDVVETIELRRTGPRATQWHALEAAEIVDDHTVQLSFCCAGVRWQHLLGTVGVLPVGARSALDDHRQQVAVSGGWFRLVEHDPGRLLRFEAHAGGPLGAPQLASVDVFIVPSFERALGLIDRGEIDAALGYLAIGAVTRATELEGVTATAPAGGTWVGLDWRAGEPSERRAVGDSLAVDDFVTSLLDVGASVATSPWADVEGPWRTGRGSGPQLPDGIVGGYPRGHDTLGALANAIERQVGGSVQLISENTPEFLAVARDEHDVALRIFRDPPRGSLTRWTTAGDVLAAETSDDPVLIEV